MATGCLVVFVLTFLATAVTATDNQTPTTEDNMTVDFYKLYRESEKKTRLLEQEITQLRHQNSQMLQQVDQLKKQRENLSSMRVDNSSVISFEAYTSMTRTYNPGSAILFDSILRNYGGFYNGETGVFLCPKNGYYLFWSSLATVGGSDLDAAIFVDNEEVVHIASSEDGFDQSPNLVVAYCSIGRLAKVNVVQNEGVVYGETPISSFSGTLLFELTFPVRKD